MTSRRTLAALAAATVLAGGLAACGSSKSDNKSSGSTKSTASGSAAASSAVKVTIKSFKFMAPSVTVKKGGKVTWTNQDSAPHTATASDAAQKSKFDTGTLKNGQSKSITFSSAGTYKYLCQFHPFMTGSVVVE
jgi:amicyanin